jgi:nitrogen regulatory protein PII
MRLIIATIKPSQVETVRQALSAVHVTRLTICDAQSYVPSRSDSVFQDVVLEIAVNEDFVARTVETLAAALGPEGPAESGRLVVLPMEDAVQIYREVRGQEAI